MAKPRIRHFDLKAQQAAYLKAERGLSQHAIGQVLTVSQSAVSRLLDRARELGCLRETSEFVRTHDIGDERFKHFERLLEHSDLAERVSLLPRRTDVRLRSVRIVDSGSTDVSDSG